jgi:ligand-binding SRPBCC domain-containing protein
MPHRSEFADWVPFPLKRVFLFFANPENLPRVMPPAADTRIEGLSLVSPPLFPGFTSLGQPLAGVGSEIVTSFRLVPPLPFRGRWIARITEFEWNHYFANVQVQGPFKSWLHRHELAQETRNGIDGTVVSDRIEHEIGFGSLGAIAQKVFVDPNEGYVAHPQRILEGLLRRADGSDSIH